MDLNIRWMEQKDIPEVVSIQKEFESNYTENDAKKFAKKKASICAVVELDERIVGFAFYEIKGISKIKINELCVRTEHRRKGVGTFLINSLISKLNQKRNKIEVEISEYNLIAQLFLKNKNFKVTEIQDQDNFSIYKFVYKQEEAI